MQHIFDIHDYDENFAERFCSHTIPIYDLWSIRPLQNQMKEIISGTSADVEKCRNFLTDHANKDYPHELVIVIGNAEKSNPGNMLNSTKKYFKLKFDKYKGNDLGQPLFLGGTSVYPVGQEQMMPTGFSGFPVRPQTGTGNMGGFGGFSYQDLQGIIDKNVSDATRSIKAEYDEISAKREAEAIKRIADLEMKMELYKLELRAREIEEKERKLMDQLEEFEERKAEGLGTVKEYTKTIAGGLLELGKSALGLSEADDLVRKSFKKKNKSDKDDLRPEPSLKGTKSVFDDDDGFADKGNQENISDNSFDNLIGMIKGLSVEQRMQLMDVLIPEDEFAGRDTENEENENLNKENQE
jgi:hypothetical protein